MGRSGSGTCAFGRSVVEVPYRYKQRRLAWVRSFTVAVGVFRRGVGPSGNSEPVSSMRAEPLAEAWEQCAQRRQKQRIRGRRLSFRFPFFVSFKDRNLCLVSFSVSFAWLDGALRRTSG